ncbi:heparinase II/III domain-containing protein [Cerasicoccus maritimus]|uniref:heparinase II/III domain-containing protein n=1 Tax=Cerasicoccus maritimus TaxID=490089 RepID=UPI002852B5F9|nr:heparinase II/III family protein [Cerasicoccus maritimus]
MKVISRILAFALIALLCQSCDDESAPKITAQKEAVPAPSVAEEQVGVAMTIEQIDSPEVLPSLGDETPKKASRSTKVLPPPPAPTKQEIDRIATMVTPYAVGIGAPASDRAVWDAFAAQPDARALIAQANIALKTKTPELTQELWELFEMTGDRKKYQDASSARYNRLVDMALGEALQYKGRYLPEIEKTIREILAQGAWSVPAHGKELTVFRGEVRKVDLAATQVAGALATVDFWLADVLPADLRAEIKDNVRERVLTPYLTSIREGKPIWWMSRPNNWTAVCCGAVTSAALTLEQDPQVRAEFIADAEVLMGRYIDSFASDGISEEGVGYWGYGFSHFLYASEMIRRTTQGGIDLLADDKVMQVSQSPRTLELVEGVYGAFGDQSVNAKPERRLVDFAAMRYGMPGIETEQFGRIDAGARHPLGPLPYSLIMRSFGQDAPRVNGVGLNSDAGHDFAMRSWFPASELFICRPGSVSEPAMSVAIRSGNNGESHNHNDIGSYVVAYKGKPVLVDPGMERYTAASFSPRRYEASLNNSFGHAVPLVANRMQKNGAEAMGEIVQTQSADQADVVELDMTEAYRAPDLEKLTRTLIYERAAQGKEGAISIADSVSFANPQAFSTAIVTRGSYELLDSGVIRVSDKGVSLYVSIETKGKAYTLAESPVTGFSNPEKSLARRLGIYLTDPVDEATITINITPEEPQA